MRAVSLILSLFLQTMFLPQAALGSEGRGAPYIKLESETIQEEGQSKKLEMATVMPRHHQDIESAVKWAAEEFHQETSSKKSIVIVTPEGDNRNYYKAVRESRNVIRELNRKSSKSESVTEIHANVPHGLVRRATDRAREVGAYLKKHERVTFTVAKTTMNGVVTGTTLLLIAGLAPTTAIPIAIASSALSGSFMFFNAQFQKFLAGDTKKNERLIRNSRFGSVRVRAVSMTKLFFTNIATFTLMNVISYAAGAPTGTMYEELIKTIRSVSIGTASRGIWDTTIADQTRRDIESTSDSQRQANIQFRSNAVTFGLSIVSTFAGTLMLVGSPIGAWTMGALGAAGVVYAVRAWRKNRSERTADGTRSRPREVIRPNFRARNCRSVFAM